MVEPEGHSIKKSIANSFPKASLNDKALNTNLISQDNKERI